LETAKILTKTDTRRNKTGKETLVISAFNKQKYLITHFVKSVSILIINLLSEGSIIIQVQFDTLLILS
jgi:hypothetical protein